MLQAPIDGSVIQDYFSAQSSNVESESNNDNLHLNEGNDTTLHTNFNGDNDFPTQFDTIWKINHHNLIYLPLITMT